MYYRLSALLKGMKCSEFKVGGEGDELVGGEESGGTKCVDVFDRSVEADVVEYAVGLFLGDVRMGYECLETGFVDLYLAEWYGIRNGEPFVEFGGDLMDLREL